jgi:general stress protein YciG
LAAEAGRKGGQASHHATVEVEPAAIAQIK